MINKSMKEPEKVQPQKTQLEKKPNELNGVYFSSHIKIFDPNTKQVLVQKRTDV